MAALGLYSDKGRIKQVDQDACCFFEAQSKAGRVIMAIVCDGVGGLAKGELASSTVIRRFADWFTFQLPRFIEYNAGDEGLMDALSNVWGTLLQMAAEDIFRYSEKNDVALGTTFTGMIVVGDRFIIGHVGDCRAYEITANGAIQLTQDQTLVAQQLEAGLITEDEARHHPKRNVILQSVGTTESVEPVFSSGDFNSEAVYLLCCDGFYNRLEEGELHSLFTRNRFSSEGELQAICAETVRDVISRGEKDNITVLAFTDIAAGASMPNPTSKAALAGDGDLEEGLTEVVSVSTAGVGKQDESQRNYGSDDNGCEDADDAFDEDEGQTIVVDEDDSPTVVVKGGGK